MNIDLDPVVVTVDSKNVIKTAFIFAGAIITLGLVAGVIEQDWHWYAKVMALGGIMLVLAQIAQWVRADKIYQAEKARMREIHKEEKKVRK